MCVCSDEIEVNQPIRVVNFHLGVCEVSPEGKPSLTVIKRVSTNGKSSLVMCACFALSCLLM